MFTSNSFVLLAIFSSLRTSQALKEVLKNITASSGDVKTVIEQVTARSNSSKEFTAVLNYFKEIIVYENGIRDVVASIGVTRFGDNNDGKNVYGRLDWETAINDALDEANITSEFYSIVEENAIKHVEHYLRNLKDPKEKIKQNVKTRRFDDGYFRASNSSEEGSFEQSKEDAFWGTQFDIPETRRIFGGNRTKIKYFPFMASVLIFERFSCAGSIIQSDLVITAASCLQLAWNNRFFRENPAFLSVRVGSNFFNVGGELVPVIGVFFHPSYIPKTLVNNLALMRLERHLSFRKRHVKKIDFDRSESALPYNTPGITIVGWGAKTHANKIYNAMLNMIHMTVLDAYDLPSCREVYGKKFVTKTNFCAGFISSGQGACNLDVGDPGVLGRTLMGVVSFGSPTCGRTDTPTVFTKLGYYTDWIEEIMEQDIPEVKQRTTTWSPYKGKSKAFKILESESDESPISPLREGFNFSLEFGAETSDEERSNTITKEPGIPPILKGEPAYVEFLTTRHIQRSGEHDDYKGTDKSAEAKNNMEKESNIISQVDADVDSTKAKTVEIKSDETDLEFLITSETDGSEQENAIKMSVAPDQSTGVPYSIEDDSRLEFFDDAVSNVKPVTNMGHFEPEHDYSIKTKTTPHETDNKDKSEIEDSLESKVDEALRNLPYTLPMSDDNSDEPNSNTDKLYLSKKKHKKTKKKNKKYSTTPSSADGLSLESASVELNDFENVDNWKDVSLETDLNASRSGDYHAETKPQITEELIEREIKNLLKQLEFSDEGSSKSKNRKITDNSKGENDADAKRKTDDGANDDANFKDKSKIVDGANNYANVKDKRKIVDGAINYAHIKGKRKIIDAANNYANVKDKRKIVDGVNNYGNINTNAGANNYADVKDKRKSDDMWTLLYISDNEKEIRQRGETSGEEDVNIDTAPFRQLQSNTERNANYGIIGKSEIYQLFAEVIKAVVNKTSHL